MKLEIFPRTATPFTNYYRAMNKQTNKLADDFKTARQNPSPQSSQINYTFDRSQTFTIDDIYTALGQVCLALTKSLDLPDLTGAHLFYDHIYTPILLAQTQDKKIEGFAPLKESYKSGLKRLSDISPDLSSEQYHINTLAHDIINPLIKTVSHPDFSLQTLEDAINDHCQLTRPTNLVRSAIYNPRLNATWQSLLATAYIEDIKLERPITQTGQYQLQLKKQLENHFTGIYKLVNTRKKRAQKDAFKNWLNGFTLSEHCLYKVSNSLVKSYELSATHCDNYYHNVIEPLHSIVHCTQKIAPDQHNIAVISRSNSGIEHLLYNQPRALDKIPGNGHQDYSGITINYNNKQSFTKKTLDNYDFPLNRGHKSFRSSGTFAQVFHEIADIMHSENIPFDKNFKNTILDMSFHLISHGGHTMADIPITLLHLYAGCKINIATLDLIKNQKVDFYSEEYDKTHDSIKQSEKYNKTHDFIKHCLDYNNKVIDFFQKEFHIYDKQPENADIIEPRQKNNINLILYITGLIPQLRKLNEKILSPQNYATIHGKICSIFKEKILKSEHGIHHFYDFHPEHKEGITQLFDIIEQDPILKKMSVNALKKALLGKSDVS